MKNYTDNEMKMLKAFYDTSVDCCGQCSNDDNMSWNNAKDLQEVLGGTMQEVGGTMSSLESKGAIVDNGDSARGARINDFFLADMEVAAHFDKTRV